MEGPLWAPLGSDRLGSLRLDVPGRKTLCPSLRWGSLTIWANTPLLPRKAMESEKVLQHSLEEHGNSLSTSPASLITPCTRQTGSKCNCANACAHVSTSRCSAPRKPQPRRLLHVLGAWHQARCTGCAQNTPVPLVLQLAGDTGPVLMAPCGIQMGHNK